MHLLHLLLLPLLLAFITALLPKAPWGVKSLEALIASNNPSPAMHHNLVQEVHLVLSDASGSAANCQVLLLLLLPLWLQ
jgi:hypothetical protein